MNKNRIAAAAMFGALLAAPAMAADNFSYNLLEIGLIGTQVDDQSGDLDTEGGGLSLAASAELTPNIFGFINLSGVTQEFKYYDDESFDIGRAGIGVGFNLPLTRNLDLVSGISLEGLRMETDEDTFSGDGYGLRVGLRGGGGRVEWHAGVKYVDLKFDGLPDDDSFSVDDTFVEAGFRYKFTRTFALGLDVAGNGDDETSATLAFRWNFNDRN